MAALNIYVAYRSVGREDVTGDIRKLAALVTGQPHVLGLS